VEFRVLGPLQVSCDGAEITVPAGKQRALLAALLLRASRVVSTMELVRWIWGDAPQADARATAQTYVRRLRRRLGDGLIVTRPDGYLIALTAGQLDLVRFDELLEHARRAADPAVEVGLLDEALALWRVPALSDVPSEVLHRDEVPGSIERWCVPWSDGSSWILMPVGMPT
jgi:DNA-binding SARP family transcriptional activator